MPKGGGAQSTAWCGRRASETSAHALCQNQRVTMVFWYLESAMPIP